MAESTLSIDYAELRRRIGRYLGYGGTSGNWGTSQTLDVNDCLDNGLRLFYRPPRMPDASGRLRPSHDWSFLRPVTSISVVPVLQTGTDGTVAAGGTDLTEDGGTVDWSALGIDTDLHHVVITDGTGDVTDGSYAITDASAAGTLVIADCGGAGTCSYSVELIDPERYELAEGIGGIEGVLTHADNSGYAPVEQTGEARIRRVKSVAERTGAPELFAIRAKTHSASTGQRFEVILEPTPDQTYTLYGRGLVLMDQLADSEYPPGGMMHSSAILLACLSVAEVMRDEAHGVQHETFLRALEASIDQDLSVVTPDTLGYCGDGSDGNVPYPRGRSQQRTVDITVDLT